MLLTNTQNVNALLHEGRSILNKRENRRMDEFSGHPGQEK
jgi:hypothetical protein